MKKMRTFRLDKLVRDKIVEHHISMGGTAAHKQLKGKELTMALVDKLIEEAEEMKKAELSLEEIADLQEVIDSLRKNLGVSHNELAVAQEKKRQKNGGFEKGHHIETVTLPADNKWATYYASDPSRFPEVDNE